MFGVPVAASVLSSAVSLKAPTPRIFGYLPGTIQELQEGVEGKTANLNNRTYTDLETVDLIFVQRNVNPNGGVWRELLPTWRPTPAALARIKQLDPNFVLRPGAAPAGAAATTSTVQQALDPLRAALAAGGDEAALREALAQTIERVGVGGGAAGAAAVRGTSGPLDQLIAFAQQPTGAVVLAVTALLILVGGVALLARR